MAHTCRCSWLGWLPHPCGISKLKSIHPFSNLHLCKFICDTNCRFIAVRLDLSMEVHVFCGDEFQKSTLLNRLGSSFPSLSRWSKLVTCSLGHRGGTRHLEWSAQEPHIQWSEVFNYIQRVNIVQVTFEAALDVVYSFQLNGHEPALDLHRSDRI